MSKLNENALVGFLEYAKEANTRSTLAVEDGLKPVHRRILYTMGEDKILSNKHHVKSAKIVGQVLGNYHPHGDSSVYDAAVRLSQDFKLRYPLIDFDGNGGSILEPDSYAAARYTGMRLSPLGEMMLQDLEKNTVPMTENYSGDLMEPVVLPSMIPNTLLNGGMGIGVGVSSSLLPHNLTEVCDGIVAYIKNPRITTEELMHFIQGPDFPTGAVVTDALSLKDYYENGKGSVKVRGKYSINIAAGRSQIIITELPYLLSPEKFIASVQTLVAEHGYDKIYDVQNASGQKGLEIRIILEKDVNPTSVLQTLFEKTGLESTLKINNTVMLPDGSFVLLGLRGLISYYLKHQHNILTRKYQWELNKAQERLNIVEGLIIAVQNIDEVVAIIKASTSTITAKAALIKRFTLNDAQAAAILDMRLARLTSLEITKLTNEQKELLKSIEEFKSIIGSEKKREEIIVKFLLNLKTKFGDARRTKISEMKIVEKGEHVYLVVDTANQFFSLPKDEISTLSRKKGSPIGKDTVVAAIEANTKDEILALDNNGKIYLVHVQDIVNGDFRSEAPIIQLVKLEEKDFLVFITENGIIKKTPMIKFRKSAQMTKVKEDDKLIGMYFANDSDFVMALGVGGKAVNIPVSEISALGKLTYGAKGISTDQVLAATVAESTDLILTITSENKAKLTKHEDFLINAKATTGQLVTEDCIWIQRM
jgi:DNA gyrase subunit A